MSDHATQPSDLDLIAEFKAGKEQAFNDLVRRYQERVYWVVRRLVSDHSDADDIVQEIFVKVYRSLYGFKGESAFYTWLYRIAVNISINELRRRKIRKAFSIDDQELVVQSEDDTPDVQLEKEELKTAIAEAIDALPEKQKRVFILRYYEELPYEEISKILKTSVGGLKANYFHAVRKIGDRLKHGTS